ncbi:putative RelE/StbE family addiction module toxin [Pseudomonas sp. FH4]|uniref:Addiction module toxin, RelE/StbE family n=1 Tax=Pseudomonas brenneri TaxID=129817 RepID=A0A5B2URF0_9PSED|nr:MULTISPECIES: type II toxin-antitoxin system RelE/ParE family toxin [Pseudomonas fluorescens group]MBT9302170.1 type II toxin-antitoxin system RelE/ParE family toxin [Pseudomonas sp. TAE6080]ETK21430.1 putative RelE/StbE family addiction module toxin [Pseudomonas sp. FH4]KAA2229012.1 type II toxin-antitoxin system RelE/ParE family toxin [Pseudomonas brenneri]MBF8004734.1 type II toxin-antitoxin system RelE/ParE family toxin [Pseudomonas brenneri]TWR76380.1 type II toxin-antitoxin system Rel
MQVVRWTEEATTDLVEIIDYIDQRNPLAAEVLYSTILRAVEGLPSAPYLFRPGRVPGSRECVVHPNYLVVYQIVTDSIDVLRVLHARREYP